MLGARCTDNYGLFPSTFLRLAFLEYNLTNHHHAIQNQPISPQNGPLDVPFSCTCALYTISISWSTSSNKLKLVIVAALSASSAGLRMTVSATRRHSVCKLLRYYVMYLADKSVQNTKVYLKEQHIFLERGL